MEKILATEAQKVMIEKHGGTVEDGLTISDANKIIENYPATEEQKALLERSGAQIPEGLTIGGAANRIAMLPATEKQIQLMHLMKMEIPEKMTMNAAAKVINQKIQEQEEINNSPATDKQKKFLKDSGVENIEGITFGEARTVIYKLPVTEKQLEYLNNHDINYDHEKLSYGYANKVIQKYQEEQRLMPATESQIEALKKSGIKYEEDITKAAANEMLQKKYNITAKQKEMLQKYKIEIPADANKKIVSNLIGVAIKQNAIDRFIAPTDRKMSINEGYKSLAQSYIKKDKPINDKAIAAQLLKEGHNPDAVTKALFTNSPELSSYSIASKNVTEALKMPSVKEKVKIQNNQR